MLKAAMMIMKNNITSQTKNHVGRRGGRHGGYLWERSGFGFVFWVQESFPGGRLGGKVGFSML